MNKKGIFSGRTETPLASEGIRQSHLAGQAAKNMGIDAIVSSPMKRALDTATIIANEIGFDVESIIVSDLFMERAFGILEGETYVPNMHKEDIEGVEKAEEILARAQAGLIFLESLSATNILVVSHGSIGRAMRHKLHPDIPFHGSQSFPNAEVVRLL